jgi:thiol-disulfide isomerase/thioredoxin
MNKFILGVIGIIAIVGGFYFVNMSLNGVEEVAQSDQKNAQNSTEADGEMTKKETVSDKENTETETMMKKDTKTAVSNKETEMMNKSDEEMAGKEETMVKVGSYESYDASKIARAKEGEVVIFFHASWCPSCRALNSNIESNLTLIPENTTILKADYDTETELKKKYGVTYQHTLVQVDKNGELIKKWSGSPSLEDLLGKMQ